jgi:prepilin-type processing-associated H-X9-DG protein
MDSKLPSDPRLEERGNAAAKLGKPGWLTLGIGSVAIIAVLGIAIPFASSILELDRRDVSKSNLLGLGVAMKMFAYTAQLESGGNPRELFPPLSTEPGIIQMDTDSAALLAALLEVRQDAAFGDLFISPGHPQSKAASRQAKKNPVSAVNDDSYWYLGYALPDEQRGLAFVEWYKEHARLGPIPSPSVIETADVRIHRLKMEIDTFLLLEDIKSGKAERPKGCGSKMPSEVPVVIEWPGLLKGGAHVLYADGHTRFLAYPGEYPMTENFIEALNSLGALIPQ